MTRMIGLEDIKNIEQRRPAPLPVYPVYDLPPEEEEMVRNELERLSEVLENWISQHDERYRDGCSPMYNTGYKFANDVFIALAYDWSDYELDVNFYHFASGLDITWYKHAWRATCLYGEQSIQIVRNGKFPEIIDDCIASLSRTEENQIVPWW